MKESGLYAIAVLAFGAWLFWLTRSWWVILVILILL
jgi:hypothetical protein